MTVKELLIQLRPMLITHAWATLWSQGTRTEQKIDIEHNHYFHAVGKFTTADDFKDTDFYILQPFKYSYYHGYQHGKPKEFSILDDFEVYRWRLERDKENDRLWNLEIETHQT